LTAEHLPILKEIQLLQTDDSTDISIHFPVILSTDTLIHVHHTMVSLEEASNGISDRKVRRVPIYRIMKGFENKLKIDEILREWFAENLQGKIAITPDNANYLLEGITDFETLLKQMKEVTSDELFAHPNSMLYRCQKCYVKPVRSLYY